MERNLTRDIDYAALAVKKSLTEKFGRQNDLGALEVTAGERTITVRDGTNLAEGTRDALMVGIHAASCYADCWSRWQSRAARAV
jgi:hypothetical protein